MHGHNKCLHRSILLMCKHFHRVTSPLFERVIQQLLRTPELRSDDGDDDAVESPYASQPPERVNEDEEETNGSQMWR